MPTPNKVPELLCNHDGGPQALRYDQARSPAAALRVVIEDYGFDWLLEDMPGSWNNDETTFRLDIGPLRSLVRDIKKGWHRIAETDDEKNDEWGADTWFHCTEDHPGAVAYWEIGE